GFRRHLDDARARWTPQAKFQWPDWHLMLGDALLALYEATPAQASAVIEACWPAYRRSLMQRSEFSHVCAVFYRAAAALAVERPARARARAGSTRNAGRELARAAQAELASRKGVPHAAALAALLRAGLARAEHDDARTVQALREGVAAAERADLRMW